MEVPKVFATATSAFRNALNGLELADEIFKQTGIKINIIDGEKEAHLILKGVKQALDFGEKRALIMDIGGGSVEFIIADSEQVHWLQSFEIGAQRLMDQFHKRDPILTSEINDLEHYLESELVSLGKAIQQFQPEVLIGASGTFDTLCHIYSLKNGLSITDNPEQTLSFDGFQQIHSSLISKNREQRLAMPGMIEMRVDMIVVASSLIDFILKRFKLRQIRVSSFALKEGVLSEIIESESLG